MNIACVIGNGPSRKTLSLETIGSKMTTYGCNALYRDYMPNYLVSMDYDMVKEILNNKVHHKITFYTQHDNETIYIVGFDYNNGGGSLPNVYAGTNQYPRSHIFPAASMQTDKWRQRLNKILKEYPNKKIVRVNGNNKSFDMPYNNYSEITIEQFKEIYE